MSLGHCPEHGLYHDPSQGCPVCFPLARRRAVTVPLRTFVRFEAVAGTGRERLVAPGDGKTAAARERSAMLKQLNRRKA